MKKKLIRGFLTLTIVLCGGAAITMTSNDVYACKKCNLKPSDRECGECKSSRLFAGKVWTAENGRQRTPWKCADCGHCFITELQKGKEVILTEDQY